MILIGRGACLGTEAGAPVPRQISLGRKVFASVEPSAADGVAEVEGAAALDHDQVLERYVTALQRSEVRHAFTEQPRRR